MSKMQFLALCLIFVALILGRAVDGLGISQGSNVQVLTRTASRPSIGVSWSDAGSRNRIVFIPATTLLVLVGVVLPLGLVGLTIHVVRLT